MSATKSLLKKILKYAKTKGFNREKIQKAFDIAEKAHSTQRRKSGEPFILHPLQIAYYLTTLNADEDSIISAILHDTVEDSNVSLQDIHKEFGSNIEKLIDGLTKVKKHKFRDADTLDRKIESLRKWFKIMQDDVRVAVIKIVDRIHNMETLAAHKNPEKEKRIAKESLDVFVKLAHKLGVNSLRLKLEPLCLKYIDPKSYHTLASIQEKESKAAKKVLPIIKKKLSKISNNNEIIQIRHEAPSLLKMHDKEVQIKEEIKGALPFIFVINVKNVQDCYHVLYLIHSIWKVKKYGVADYINNPAPNGYRGIHSTVIFEEGRYIVFKIRTSDMEQYFRYGVTLSCFSKTKEKHGLLSWIKHLPHITKESASHSKTFWNQLQHDILETSIIVHTEKDDILLLPANSTALDAAFHSYGDQTWKLEKIFVNGVNEPFYKHLHQNDTIHCYFGDSPTVQYKWLEHADTALATSIIKEGLQNNDDEIKAMSGESILHDVLNSEGKGFIEELDKESLQNIFKKYHVSSLHELKIKIAEGAIDPREIAFNLYKKKSDPKFFHKYVQLSGSLNALNTFLKEIPYTIKKHCNYTIKGSHNNNILKLHLSVSNFQWKQFQMLLNRTDNIQVIIQRDTIWQRKNIFYVFLITLFWGLDPFVAGLILKQTPINPFGLTLLRFWSMSLILFIIILSLKSFSQKKIKLTLPIFNKEIFIIAISLFCVALFTYLGLENGLASDYLLGLRPYSAIILTALVLKLYPKTRNKIIFPNALILLGLIALFVFHPHEWHIIDKMWIILAVIAFSLYSYLNNYFRHNKKLKVSLATSSLLNFQFLLSMQCALFSMPFLFIVPWEGITTIQYIIATAFVSLFGIVPHLLYFKLIRERHDITMLANSFHFVYFVALIAEIAILQIFPSASKLVATVFIFGGILILVRSAQSKNINNGQSSL